MNKITFTAKNPYGWEVTLRPFPTSQAIPEWWRAQTPYVQSPDNPDGKKLLVQNFNSNASFKKCTPMLDALTSGYIIPLWTDVHVTQVNGNPIINWKTTEEVFSVHGSTVDGLLFPPAIQTPHGYSKVIFKFNNFWTPHTPKGYSCLVTSPFGYQDGAVKAVPAVIDTDKSTLEIVPPVWIQEGFEGVIEKGTPIIQIIPFKRDDWKAEFNFLKDGEYERITDKNFNSTIVNHYVKNKWSKKTFK